VCFDQFRFTAKLALWTCHLKTVLDNFGAKCFISINRIRDRCSQEHHEQLIGQTRMNHKLKRATNGCYQCRSKIKLHAEANYLFCVSSFVVNNLEEGHDSSTTVIA